MLTRDRFSFEKAFSQVFFEKKRTETLILAGLIFLGCLGFIASQSHFDRDYPHQGIYEELHHQAININSLSFNNSVHNYGHDVALVSLAGVYCNY